MKSLACRLLLNLSVALSFIIFCADRQAIATDQKILDGWGSYKFGMTVDQARAVRGISWKKTETQTTKLGSLELTWLLLDSRNTQTIGGKEYGVHLNFKPDTGLRSIQLSHTAAAPSVTTCERVFVEALYELEQLHGVFVAEHPAGEQKTPFGTRKVEWRSVPKAQSVYGLRTEVIQGHAGVFAEAIRKFGKSRASIVSRVGSAPRECKLEIAYTEPKQ